jgi:4-aminobutyrate aminotransferase-like enzyme
VTRRFRVEHVPPPTAVIRWPASDASARREHATSALTLDARSRVRAVAAVLMEAERGRNGIVARKGYLARAS